VVGAFIVTGTKPSGDERRSPGTGTYRDSVEYHHQREDDCQCGKCFGAKSSDKYGINDVVA